MGVPCHRVWKGRRAGIWGLGTPARGAGEGAWRGHRDYPRQTAWRCSCPHPSYGAPQPTLAPPNGTPAPHSAPTAPSSLESQARCGCRRCSPTRNPKRSGRSLGRAPGRRAAARHCFLRGKEDAEDPAWGSRSRARRPERQCSSCHRTKVSGRIMRPVDCPGTPRLARQGDFGRSNPEPAPRSRVRKGNRPASHVAPPQSPGSLPQVLTSRPDQRRPGRRLPGTQRGPNPAEKDPRLRSRGTQTLCPR